MPEYLYPGVYVEAYDARTTSIPGVSTSTDDATGGSLVAEICEVVRRAQPGWTDPNNSDPGVMLLELAAWLSETLVYRAGGIPEQGRQAALRAVAALWRLADPCGQTDGTITRPRFFAGQLLDAAALQLEQDYHREMLRRHNRALLGAGIVQGLGVRVEATNDAPDGCIRLEPGYAIDPCGNEIAVGRGAVLALPRAGAQLFVSLRHWDRPTTPVPSPHGEPTPSRIEEACIVGVVDVVAEPAIALARLLRPEGRWIVDPGFVPLRVPKTSA
jgi:hypothetical protein